jgi:hypothetical protein
MIEKKKYTRPVLKSLTQDEVAERFPVSKTAMTRDLELLEFEMPSLAPPKLVK